MLSSLLLLALSAIVSQTTQVAALGSACGVPLTTGNAAWGEPYWLENIQHQGLAPFAPNATKYKVFRNVREYGAVGDGVHDDTAAIKCAILPINDHIIMLIFVVLQFPPVADVVT